MICVVPLETPVTVPLPDPIVAIRVFAVLHVPPDAVFAKVVVAPTQVVLVPVIAAGVRFTVNTEVVKQPDDEI